VAGFSGWVALPYIINRERCGFPVMGGWEKLPTDSPNEKQQLLNELIAHTTQQHPEEVYDSIIYHAAHEQLLAQRPRVLFVSFLETDFFGHRGRYDQLLE